ncbi:MAG: glycosyl hydrolase family 8 [Paludibacteraceae bacterium]|nr:glycosyl hydrolase family 8 [Paludibacteraceae bacterium]
MNIKKAIRRSFALLFVIISSVTSIYSVEVHINSGNPAFPFPQFLEYTYGDFHRLGNLGTKNAEGVVHAEMEQEVRDAYQIHANEFAYTGEEYKGIKYICTPDVPGGYYGCTESQGYALLAAAYMADQVTFNGYWFWVHDYKRNRSRRYNDGTPISPSYVYGMFTINDGQSGDSAADGDVDVALALYAAYKQWGEFMKDQNGNIVTDFQGNPISYKKEMVEVIRGLVTLCARKFKLEGDVKLVQSGVIGLDGYMNGGNTWTELTDWCTGSSPMSVDYDLPVYAFDGETVTNEVLPAGTPISKDVNPGPAKQHIDYYAPAYFREFWELFEEIAQEENIPLFDIEQFKRAEASSDWLIGNLISKSSKSVPVAGWVEMVSDGNFTFSNFNEGEDYRCPWRTISNYMWHGNPNTTWNPKTHKVESGTNTFEYDAAVRMSNFLENPIGWATGECMVYGDPKIPYSGPSTLEWCYNPNTGESTEPETHFMVINWLNGMGSFSAVSAQNYELMGSLYRQCAIDWDFGTDPGDFYLTSVPHYMHGWARHLGLMVTSGNYHAPSQMNPMANMKIYRSIEDSVTYCYTGDQLKYVLDYRNYGSLDAKDVKIVENVPEHFVFVEASNGGVYDKASHTVTWNIGTVSGFKSDDNSGVELNFNSGNLAKTVGQVWYKVKVGDNASGRYCTTAEITCSNGLGWVSNEYPNFKTSTMQRNCVDVVPRSLIISKDVDRRKVNDGNMATFTIKFENSSDAGWIDGGRPRVNVSFANGLDGSRIQLMARLWNDAVEPYINYGNYRISYYLYDASINCYTGDGDCTSGWGIGNEIYEGNKMLGSDEGVVVTHENIVEGSDAFGKWNQRMCIQFAPLLVTTTMHLARFFGGDGGRVHKGGTSPMRAVWALYPSNYGSVNWEDDWSWSASYNSAKDGLFYPITPSWQKLDENGKSIEEPVTKWLTCGCTESEKTVPNILVEEYDGYVWRRILGNGPMPGRDVDNVEIRDTLPKGLKFGEFVNECPLSDPEFGGKWEVKQTDDDRDIIVWSIPKLQVKQKGSIIYTATASFPSGNVCETPDEDILNYAWISGDKNSPFSDTALITVTCAKVPEPIKPTTLTKVADKESYEVGDDIEYTIGYKQTHGAIFDDAASVSSNWNLSGGASISAGKISISSGKKAEFKNIANNIYIETQWTVADDQETAIYFRDDIKLVFKNEYSGLSVTCYDGSKKVDSKIIAKAKSPSKLCVKLQDDILGVWLNKDTATSASVSFEQLTKKDGHFGFEGVAWGDFSYSNIHIHTDYAYDLSIIDRIPAEVEYGSASGDGVANYYKGTEGDSIVWTNIASNPIAFGDSFTVSWKGKVKECAESIINIAYAKLLGHDDNEIMAQAVSGCGASCNLTSLTLTADEDETCNDSIVLHANAKSSGNYVYEFFQDGTKVGSTTKVDTFVAKISGNYTVKVTDPSDATCTLTSDPTTIVIKERPTGDDYPIGLFCEGVSSANNSIYQNAITALAQKESDGCTISWYNAAGQTLSAMPNPDDEAAGTYDYRYVIEKNGCYSDTLHMTYAVSDTAVLDLKDVSICSGQTATLSVPSDASYTYKWSDNTTTTNELSTSVAGTYSVIVTNGDGCESHASAKVTVADKLEVDLGKDTTVCEKTLPYVLDATANYDSFDWGDGVSTQTYNVTSSGTYKVTVTQGTCSGEGSVTVTVSSIEDPTGTFSVSYKVSDTTSAGVFDKTLTQQDVSVLDVKSGVSYTWYDKNKNKISGEPIPSVPADGSNATETYYVSAKNADGCESDLKEITVTISGAPTPMVENVEYCLNEENVMALTATPTNGNNVSETWTLQWYDSNGNKISAPTPDVTTLGVQTYYVSQISDLTGAESGKVPVKVTIYGTAEPSVADNRTSYCSGDTYDPLTVTSNSDATKYLMPGDMVWTVDGTEVGATPTIPQSASVTFTVREDYKISEGHVCKGSPVALVVTTTTIEKPSGDFTVTYLKKEGESGTFPSLIEKNSNVARTNVPGYILVWYDSNKTKLGENAPSPAYNSSWTEGDDQTLTYYVAQSNGTCESELVEVTVTISDSPMPRTSAVTYCQDDVAQPLTAEINETADVASNYTLVWYDPNTKEELPNAPTPETNVPGEYTYMVAQRHNVTLATSSPSPLKVTIYRLPELTTTEPVAQCGGSVTLSDYIKESQGQAVTQSYYEDAAKTVTSAAVVTKSGTYYSDAYYTINSGVQCKSATVSVNVTINDLSDLTITGSQTSCPDGTVELTANAKSNDPGIVTYKWESENENTDGKYITPTLTGNYGKKYTFTVKASAGACVETVKATHEVTIDKGILTGEMTMNGVSQKVYKTCGDENITIATTHEGTDYQWTTLDGTAVSGTTSIEVTPTQTTTYVLNLTNVCATSDTVIVEVHPLAVTADWSKLNTTICEGTPFSASLNITGYDASMTGSYIKWYKNDEEQTQYANKETLSVESGKASDSGVYRYEVSNGICVIPESGTTDSGELTVVEKVTYTKTENVVSCSAEEVEIAVKTDDSDAVVTWADDATADATRMVSPTENTTYKFTVTRQTVCVTEDELDVQVKAKPEVTIEDVNLCAGDKTILKAEATGDELIGYVWTNGAGEEFTTTNLTVNPDSTEYYTITVKSKSCGDTSATVKVTVVELPELEVDSIALRSREIRVLSGGSSTNFEYRIDKGNWQTDGLFENIAYALHTAYAKDELGCEGSLMFEVVAPPVVLPEFFTPQGDGVNDEWDLAKILDVYPDAVVKVFDRYGKVVAELKGDVDSWDGSYNGKMLPSTDYWYTINIPEIDRMYSGHFTLIRSK